MRNVATIMRRELTAYFTSPIGYIFMIVFVTISVGLYMSTFFAAPVVIADMRDYFGYLPLLFAVFIPAVTMRSWAEERKENTWEMLLTFPMKAWELVIGKFFAGLIFLALTLLATATIPIMLAALGNPDEGAIFSGYLGTFLLGAYFLSIGIFFSGFFKDQIVAFVVTLLVCFAIYLLGTGLIAAIIDGQWEGLGLGTFLSEIVGLSDHFAAFTRGVVELADILYFLAWTTVFLALNIIYIDGRNRAHARVYFAATVGIVLAIGLLANWLIADTSLARFDVTEDKSFTISDASKSILSKIDTPVQIKYYVTPKSQMPTGMTDLEQDITDKLDELRVASNGNIEYQVINLRVEQAINAMQEQLQPQDPENPSGNEPAEDAEKVLEERMLEKGIQPFSVSAMSEDQMTNKLVYSTLGIAYKDKQEELITPVMPELMPELEYRVVSTVYKLTREDKPVVALVAPKEAVNIPPELRQLYMQMGQPVPETEDPYSLLEMLLNQEKYEVQRVDLTRESPLPEEYDTLVVVNPRDFSPRQRWEINRALRAGKSVVLAVQQYEWDYTPQARTISLNKRPQNPQLDPLLIEYGLNVSEDILMDVNHVPLTISSGSPLDQLLGGGQTLNLPMHILINNDTMDKDTSITSRLNSIFYLWGTALELDEEKLEELKLEHRVLMSSTENAWTVGSMEPLTQAVLTEPPAGEGERYPLAVLVSGQFPDAFEGEERPAWPVPQPQPGQPPQPPMPEDAPPADLTPAPGKLILIGGAEMFRDNFLQQAGNVDLFLNSIDAVTLGDDLVNVRGRKPIDRAVSKPPDNKRTFWKVVNYGLAAVVIAGVGIIGAMLRRRSRNAYTMSFATAQD